MYKLKEDGSVGEKKIQLYVTHKTPQIQWYR